MTFHTYFLDLKQQDLSLRSLGYPRRVVLQPMGVKIHCVQQVLLLNLSPKAVRHAHGVGVMLLRSTAKYFYHGVHQQLAFPTVTIYISPAGKATRPVFGAAMFLGLDKNGTCHRWAAQACSDWCRNFQLAPVVCLHRFDNNAVLGMEVIKFIYEKSKVKRFVSRKSFTILPTCFLCAVAMIFP